METRPRLTWPDTVQRGLRLLSAALPIFSIFVSWGYSYLPLRNT